LKKVKESSSVIDKYLYSDKKRFWKEINKRKNDIKTNTAVVKSKVDLKSFENFYGTLFSHVDRTNNPEQDAIDQDVETYRNAIENKRYESPFIKNDITYALSKLKLNKACGVDKMSNEFFKHGATERIETDMRG